MDSQDKDNEKKEDFYSRGRTTDPRDFFRPPPNLQAQQEELQAQMEMYRRIQECNRGAFGTQTLRHSYLRDSQTGESVGKGNLGVQEGGPETDSCYWLPGSKQQQKGAFKDLKHSVETEEGQPNGLPGTEGTRSWFPGTQDCHTMKDHSARKHDIPSYTSRVGEHNTRPKVTKEEDDQVRQQLLEQKLSKQQPPPSTSWGFPSMFSRFFGGPGPGPGTGGGSGTTV